MGKSVNWDTCKGFVCGELIGRDSLNPDRFDEDDLVQFINRIIEQDSGSQDIICTIDCESALSDTEETTYPVIAPTTAIEIPAYTTQLTAGASSTSPQGEGDETEHLTTSPSPDLTPDPSRQGGTSSPQESGEIGSGTTETTEDVDAIHLMVTYSGGGRVEPDGETVVRRGDNVTFLLIPEGGETVEWVKVNGEAVAVIANIVVLRDLQEDKEIEVRFSSINNEQLTSNDGEGGNEQLTTDTTETEETTETTVVVPEGYHHVTVVATGGGSAMPTDVWVEEGTNVTIAFKPDAGKRVGGATVNGESVTVVANSVVLLGVDGERVVEVWFDHLTP
jgi:hypothetical protein